MLSAGSPAAYRVVLASASPRRKELLAGIGIHCEIRVIPDIDESFPPELRGEEIPLYIARKKAEAYLAGMKSDELIITADTIVLLNDEVLGKPANRDEAIGMLQKLSGRTHRVITGVCLTTLETLTDFAVVTEVTFASLNEKEITYYVDNFAPFDKAGSYGVQERIGYIGVEKISGCYYNVMGLPVQRVYRELVRMGIQ